MACPHAERRGPVVYCAVAARTVNPFVMPCLSARYVRCRFYAEAERRAREEAAARPQAAAEAPAAEAEAAARPAAEQPSPAPVAVEVRTVGAPEEAAVQAPAPAAEEERAAEERPSWSLEESEKLLDPTYVAPVILRAPIALRRVVTVEGVDDLVGKVLEGLEGWRDGCFLVDAATIMSKWLGEAEKKVKLLFRKAREVARSGKPAIIFIDEIDALLGVYDAEVGGEARVRNQFLKEMDGLQDKSNTLHVYVIGATNKPWRLDEPFIRRFQKRIYIPPPDFRARLEIFKMYTRKLKLAPDVDLEELARITEGYSASDIKDIVMEAHLRTVRELFEKNGGVGEPRPITMEDFIEAIKSRKPSITPEMVEAYRRWFEKFRAV